MTNEGFTGTITEPFYGPRHPNPEDALGLVVTEYERGECVDRYVTLYRQAGR